MAGIYFHIPFCKKKCNYCDFYSTQGLKGIDELVKCEILELITRKNYLGGDVVRSIYFGGGTPSLLSKSQISSLLQSVRTCFDVTDDCEITFEANPDDLSEEYLKNLFTVGINRLSIGIQSFNDQILSFLGRRHDSSMLADIVNKAQIVGFKNISVDLIFGIPGFDFDTYLDSMESVIKLGIQHISAYSLTVEKGTYFHKQLINNLLHEIPEEELIKQFNATIDFCTQNGFKQYEISNYALEGFESRHNSSYWEEVKYLGVGPSAHSYDHLSRQWNINSTTKYCRLVNRSEPYFEVEKLSIVDKYNEYILTGLRTARGVSISNIANSFGDEICKYFWNTIKELNDNKLIEIGKDSIVLTRGGILISDFVCRSLFFV